LRIQLGTSEFNILSAAVTFISLPTCCMHRNIAILQYELSRVAHCNIYSSRIYCNTNLPRDVVGVARGAWVRLNHRPPRLQFVVARVNAAMTSCRFVATTPLVGLMLLQLRHALATDLPCTSQDPTDLTCSAFLAAGGWTTCAEAQTNMAACAHCLCATEPLPDIETACTMTCLSEYIQLIAGQDRCLRDDLSHPYAPAPPHPVPSSIGTPPYDFALLPVVFCARDSSAHW
jgi:hypothetical protein